MTNQSFILDKTGFPMVWVSEIDAYCHWFPLTKIQFEYFLCSTLDERFNGAWYDDILNLNKRVSIGEIRQSNYWNGLLTGLTPLELTAFAKWMGEGYQIPALEDWNAIFNATNYASPKNKVVAEMGDLNDRVKRYLTTMDDLLFAINPQLTLAEQMLLRRGAFEWVEVKTNNKWGAMGDPPAEFHGHLFNPEMGHATSPNKPNVKRAKYFGGRLIWRPND